MPYLYTADVIIVLIFIKQIIEEELNYIFVLSLNYEKVNLEFVSGQCV